MDIGGQERSAVGAADSITVGAPRGPTATQPRGRIGAGRTLRGECHAGRAARSRPRAIPHHLRSGFLALPRVTATNAAQLNGDVRRQPSLQGKIPAAVTWFQRAAYVRPGATRLNTKPCSMEKPSGRAALRFQVGQLPFRPRIAGWVCRRSLTSPSTRARFARGADVVGTTASLRSTVRRPLDRRMGETVPEFQRNDGSGLSL